MEELQCGISSDFMFGTEGCFHSTIHLKKPASNIINRCPKITHFIYRCPKITNFTYRYLKYLISYTGTLKKVTNFINRCPK